MTVRDLIELLQQTPDESWEVVVRLRIGDGAVRLDVTDVTCTDKMRSVVLEAEA